MGIKVGIIGCGYGQRVLVPAFRADARCEVVAIAATDSARAQGVASELGIPRAMGNWRTVVEDECIDAVVVATPPSVQPEIVLGALKQGKAVFAEKPIAATLADAEDMNRQALAANRPNMIDFNFTEISAWQRAKELLTDRNAGAVRHVTVQWNVETYTNRMRLVNWKSSPRRGGGALLNFVSHCLHYLEWFLGPMVGLSARLFSAPGNDRPGDTIVIMALLFQSGAAGSLSVNAAACLGTGHRVEFYTDSGALVLDNSTSDYMKGFKLLHGKRPDSELQSVTVDDPEESPHADGRILPVSRLARRFLDWVEKGVPARPDFRDGLRVQKLLEAANRSHQTGRWVEVLH